MADRFRVLEHPADVGIEAYGETLQNLFENSATGLTSIIAGASTVHATQRRQVVIESSDVERLLVRWLNEVLYLYDADRFLFSRAEFESIAETGLSGYLLGEPYDPLKHEFHMNVKAITYHQLSVQKRVRWIARVFFDV